MTNKHQVTLKTLTPMLYTVEVEAGSEEEAYDKVKQDIDEKGWDSRYWVNCEVSEHQYDASDNLEVLPPEEW